LCGPAWLLSVAADQAAEDLDAIGSGLGGMPFDAYVQTGWGSEIDVLLPYSRARRCLQVSDSSGSFAAEPLASEGVPPKLDLTLRRVPADPREPRGSMRIVDADDGRALTSAMTTVRERRNGDDDEEIEFHAPTDALGLLVVPVRAGRFHVEGSTSDGARYESVVDFEIRPLPELNVVRVRVLGGGGK
jgi:hypothetical protein